MIVAQGNRSVHRFAVFTGCCTFLLLIAGALVTSNDAGLSVPDWPLSYGSLLPPMVGGIFYEHGHRMIAASVGLLSIVLAVWLWRVETRRWVRWLGVAALGAVIAQGILGGLTVLFSAAGRFVGARCACAALLLHYPEHRPFHQRMVGAHAAPAPRYSGTGDSCACHGYGRRRVRAVASRRGVSP